MNRRFVMQFELHCPRCHCHFVHELVPHPHAENDFEDEVFGYTLGDGGTIEDTLYAALSGAGRIHCPDCDAEVPLDEDDLGRLAMTLLGSW
jgi:hypothetical protein